MHLVDLKRRKCFNPNNKETVTGSCGMRERTGYAAVMRKKGEEFMAPCKMKRFISFCVNYTESIYRTELKVAKGKKTTGLLKHLLVMPCV